MRGRDTECAGAWVLGARRPGRPRSHPGAGPPRRCRSATRALLRDRGGRPPAATSVLAGPLRGRGARAPSLSRAPGSAALRGGGGGGGGGARGRDPPASPSWSPGNPASVAWPPPAPAPAAAQRSLGAPQPARPLSQGLRSAGSRSPHSRPQPQRPRPGPPAPCNPGRSPTGPGKQPGGVGTGPRWPRPLQRPPGSARLQPRRRPRPGLPRPGLGPAMGGGAGPGRPPPTSPWAWRPACLTPGTGWGPRAPQTRCPGRGRGRPASARPALARLEWKLGSGREVDCGGKSWCWGDPERSFLCRCVSVLVSVVRVSPCGSVGE